MELHWWSTTSTQPGSQWGVGRNGWRPTGPEKAIMKLTDKFVNSLPSPAKGTQRHHDTELRGFCVQVSTTGQRSFALRYRIHGRGRYYTIGAFPTWTTVAARHRAKELRGWSTGY